MLENLIFYLTYPIEPGTVLDFYAKTAIFEFMLLIFLVAAFFFFLTGGTISINCKKYDRYDN